MDETSVLEVDAREHVVEMSSAPPAERPPADETSDARSELLQLASALRQSRDPRLLAAFLRLRRHTRGA